MMECCGWCVYCSGGGVLVDGVLCVYVCVHECCVMCVCCV